jgi:dTDP-4-dehydrorhamnose reductase
VERKIEDSGLAWTFLRPNAFMQTLLNGWAESIRAESTFYDAVEGACYAPIDARDIARVAARVLIEPGYTGKAFDLTGPEVISWEDAAKSSAMCSTTPFVLRVSATRTCGKVSWLKGILRKWQRHGSRCTNIPGEFQAL